MDARTCTAGEVTEAWSYPPALNDADGSLAGWAIGSDRVVRQHLPIEDAPPATLAAVDAAYGRTSARRALAAARALSPGATAPWHGLLAGTLLLSDEHMTTQALLDGLLVSSHDGVQVRGLAAGAQTLFSRPIGGLDDNDAALVVAVTERPSAFDPARHPDAAAEARDRLLRAMHGEGTPLEATEVASARPVRLRPLAPTALRRSPERDLVTAALIRAYGADRVRTAGLEVQTTYDAGTLARLASALRRAESYLERTLPSATEGARPRVSVVLLDPRTGELRAAWSSLVPATAALTRARRPSGSAMKPLLYALAFSPKSGGRVWTANDTIANLPRTYPEAGAWKPRNFDRGGSTIISLHDAFIQSENVAAVELLRAVGGPAMFKEAASLAGFDTAGWPSELGLVLGQADTTVLEMARLAATLIADGRMPDGQTFTGVRDRWGEVLETPPVRHSQAIDPDAARSVKQLMRDAVEIGTASGARHVGPDCTASATAYGKTGTSDATRDLWFIGGSDALAGAMHIGFEDGRPVGAPAADLAAPLWGRWFEEVVMGTPTCGAPDRSTTTGR